jgi:8-oxo-dGTP pyrophosphatase MutT (NUDIX family)
MTVGAHPDIRRTLLFLLTDEQILLAMKKRGFGVGKWNGVGGKIEAGESIEEALVRECQEEIGVTPVSWQKVAELDFVQDSDANPWHMYVHAYISKVWQGDPAESEEMKPQWYSQSTIPYEKMWEDDVYWLPKVLAGGKVSGKFTFDANDCLKRHEVSPAGWV